MTDYLRVEILLASDDRSLTAFDAAAAMRQFAQMIDKDVMVLDIATDPVTLIRIPSATATMRRLPVPDHD